MKAKQKSDLGERIRWDIHVDGTLKLSTYSERGLEYVVAMLKERYPDANIEVK